MERRLVSLLVGLFVASVVLAQSAYKWTDEDGVVHYSDVPREGAEQVDLAGFSRPTGARIGPVRRTFANTDPGAADEEDVEYDSLEVATPGAEETLWNIEGVLSVSLALQPGLQPGHQVRVYFDGTPRLVPGTNFQIEDVYRLSLIHI